MKLTAQALAKYRWPDKPDHIAFDEGIAGFGLRKRDGRHSWLFQYAIGIGAGRITRRIKIGTIQRSRRRRRARRRKTCREGY
jgi:hypothetical protein